MKRSADDSYEGSRRAAPGDRDRDDNARGESNRPYGDRSGNGYRENRDRSRNDREDHNGRSYDGHGRGRGDRDRERERRDGYSGGNRDRYSNGQVDHHSRYRDNSRDNGNGNGSGRSSGSYGSYDESRNGASSSRSDLQDRVPRNSFENRASVDTGYHRGGHSASGEPRGHGDRESSGRANGGGQPLSPGNGDDRVYRGSYGCNTAGSSSSSSTPTRLDQSGRRDDNRDSVGSGSEKRSPNEGELFPSGLGRGRPTATASISGANAVAIGVRGDPQVQAMIAGEEASASANGNISQQNGRQNAGAHRGQRRERDPTAGLDFIRTRPEHIHDTSAKRGKSGTPMKLVANYFPVQTVPTWSLFNYHVDFKPEQERTHIKKVLLRAHAALLGGYIFDGATLWTATRLKSEVMTLTSGTDQGEVELTIKFVHEMVPGDVTYLQVFNIIVRQWLQRLQFDEIGRNFYDRFAAIPMPNLRLELWPGYNTVIRHCEGQLMLNVEVIHKVLRTDTCLDLINGYRNGGHDYRQKIAAELIGSIVMTSYNRKTYKIDDIDWDTTPGTTFEKNGSKVTCADHIMQKYGEIRNIRDMRQPMLVSRAKKRDMHRGQTGQILLIPELCQMTGLSDDMRSNFNMMRELGRHLHAPPDKRMDTIQQFMSRLRRNPEIMAETDKWGLTLNPNLVQLDGRIMPKQKILMRDNGKTEGIEPDHKADWGFAFRNKNMYTCENLTKWVMLVPAKNFTGVDNLVRTMERVGKTLGFRVQQPLETHKLNNTQPQDYITGINQVMANHGGEIKMLFIILPSNKLEVYAAIKKRCCIDFGIPSQCFQSKHLSNQRGLMSIATKVVIQMNAKMGGQPWAATNPLKQSHMMVVGFDVHHCGKRKGPSVGALVATTNSEFSRYFSTVSFNDDQSELSKNLALDMMKCVKAYASQNDGILPGRIVLYRDGVGEGQLSHVYNTELVQIQKALQGMYPNEPPKFTFIIVTKKINARIVTAPTTNRPMPNYGNPPPGTIVDDVITLPERWDFYLISQHGNQGTVSPTCYNIIYDQQGLGSDKLQMFTYKMTHMYYNWSGTVAVPAPCQYARKLAYLTGIALGSHAKENLSHLLYFL